MSDDKLLNERNKNDGGEGDVVQTHANASMIQCDSMTPVNPAPMDLDAAMDDDEFESEERKLQFQKLWRQQQHLLMLQKQDQQLYALQDPLHLTSMDVPSRSSPSPSASHKRRRNRVSFCEDIICYSNPRDLDEVVPLWSSKDELSGFKVERKNLLRALKKVNFDLDKIDRSIFHLRGLEPYLSIGYNKHMQKKRALVLQGVLVEQRSQRSRGIKDREAIRQVCCDASSWARGRAEDLGSRDANAVGYEVEVPSSPKESPDGVSWGHESDLSAAPSLCSTLSGGSVSTHSSISVCSAGSFDSLNLRSPNTRSSLNSPPLDRVDELPPLPCSSQTEA